MPVDPAAIPPLTPAMAAVARPLQGVSCPLVPEALAAGDRRLLMRAMLELAPIAHTSTDFEYTLKRLLGAMGDLLDLDFIGYIDLDGATNYGLARLPGPRSRAQEFTARTHEILGWLCPSGQGSCPAVIWNRRILATDGPDGEGVWMPLQSWALGQLRGFYLLRFAQPPLTSPTALRALITECDLVLNAPYLLRQQGWTAEDTSERFNAIKEMLGLFRDIDNPDFCLEYLLILMECCRVDRGALWELGPDREIIGSLGVGLPQALLNDMTVSGQVPLVEQVLEQGRPVWIEGPDLLVSAAGHGSEGGVASHVHAF
ncbi:MAG TPA: hypothetical protein VEI97_02975, partial [bacterium]|nr:hypothetical protein [bacterium]